jgi:formylglycine-generating enzyme required for sulfatase activity
MAEIFISYKSERRKAAAHLAKILERYGYAVWFDYHLVKGDDFADEIDRRIREAKAVVVLWCKLSVQSAWVKREAALAAKLGKFVPVKIEPCELRVDFDSGDYTDLSDWNGAPRDHKLDGILKALMQKTGRSPNLDFKAMTEYEEDWRRFGALSLRAFALEEPLEPSQETGGQKQPGNWPENRADGGLLGWSKEEWERLKDSAAIARLERFAEHAHPYYAAEARERLRHLEAEAQEVRAARTAAAQAEERKVEPQAGKPAGGFNPAPFATGGSRAGDERAALAPRSPLSGQPPFAQPAAAAAAPASSAYGPPSAAEGLLRTPVTFLVGRKGQHREATLKPGESFRDFDAGPEMVVIPPGRFWMGSKEGEGNDNERPRHEVTIPKAFAAGKYPVTFDEWDAYVAAGGGGGILGFGKKDRYRPPDYGWGRGRRPVINVSWDEAHAYLKWLCDETGQTYRLLSEAEWEYCCRAGGEGRYCFGDDESQLGRYAWYNSNSGVKTHPVGEMLPNDWGLHDLHGNVSEWVEDCWNGHYHNALSGGSANTTGECSHRVLRGGSCGYNPWLLRSAYRGCYSRDTRGTAIGLRAARTLNP